MTDTEQNAVKELTRFIDEIDAQISTWRMDLCSKWGGTDALPLYPTDADLPTTTVGTVRAVVAGYKRLQNVNQQLRDEAERRQITVRDILMRFVMAVIISTVVWIPCALLGAGWQMYEMMIGISVGAAVGQALLWRDQRHGVDDG